MDDKFTSLFEKTTKVNEINITARLAADDLISSFLEMYRSWEDHYRGKISTEDLGLSKRMAVDQMKLKFHRLALGKTL